MALGRCLWVTVVERRAGAGGIGLRSGFFIVAESRAWVGVRVRSKVTVRSGISLGLGLGEGLILRKSLFSCWDQILGDCFQTGFGFQGWEGLAQVCSRHGIENWGPVVYSVVHRGSPVPGS